MRHLPSLARASVCGFVLAASGFTALASADELTVDLLAPTANVSNPATLCNGSQCPTDISLPEFGSTIPGSNASYSDGVTSFTINTTSLPVVCDEVRGTAAPYQYGATTGVDHFKPIYNNASPGSTFDVDGGGPSVVDGVFGFNGVYTITRANTTQSQVACYAINHLGDATPQFADASVTGDRVFTNAFDIGHRTDEPWVSVNTVRSPASADFSNALGYVLQIHNASHAENWHLSFGYDDAFFGTNAAAAKWYVLSSASPQPGPISGLDSMTSGLISAPYTVHAADAQAATNSVYLFVSFSSSATAVSNWNSIVQAFYPATASVFAPTGTFAQRLDDKSGVVGRVNVPTQNVASIVCSNDPAASACTLRDQDGNTAPVNFGSSVSSGAASVDPVAYAVDSNANTTAPSTTTALTVSTALTCSDPQGIFNGTPSLATSSGATGAEKLQFNFKPSGGLFVPGTATCTATFSNGGLLSTQSFTVTMQQLTTTHFAVAADANAVAGVATNFTVTALDGAGHTVSSYAGTVQFSSATDSTAVLPVNGSLTNGVGNFSGTFKKSGMQTFTATDGSITGTSNTVTVAPSTATHFSVTMFPNAVVNSPASANVVAQDAFGNEATGYTGSVHFTSTDGSATFPADGPLDHASHGLPNVVFHAVGTWTVTATDTSNGSIKGTSQSVDVEN